jgi:plasmid replication initiation protein
MDVIVIFVEVFLQKLFIMSTQKQVLVVDSDIKLIRKANEFVEARYKFDIWETRVFAYMLTLIKYNDTDFTEYEINVGDIVKRFDLNRAGLVYDEIKKASEKLLSKKVQIVRTTPEGVVEILDTYLVVSTARPKETTKDNYIKLSFHSALKPFLIELKERYLVYDIRNILSLSSIYSIRLFELLKQYQKIGKRRFQINELKLLLSIEPNEYALYGHFKDRIIKKAQKDLLEHTDIYFEFTEETEKKKVFAITFYIFDNTKNERVKSVSQKEGKTSKKVIENSTDEAIINSIFEKVKMYVSKLQVKKWLKEVPVEQIENAITYTVNYTNAGNKVKNIGGFLNSMVHTPNLFDKYEEKKTKVKKATKKQQNTSSQIDVKIAEMQQVQTDLEIAIRELESNIFSKDPLLHQTILSKIQVNQFYDHKKTVEQNLQRDTIMGLRGAFLQEMFPEYNLLLKQFDKKIKAIKEELEALRR